MEKYQELLFLHPLETKSITSFFLFGLGDLLTQKFLESGRLNSLRILKFAVYGIIFAGPLLHFWHSECLPYLIEEVLPFKLERQP
jgi:peroxisomal membrane protein 2